MNQDTILYTLPQWFIFAGIISSIFGWSEQKKALRMIGPVLFFLLGIFSCYIIAKGTFSEESLNISKEVIENKIAKKNIKEIPLIAKLFPAYLSFIISSILSIPTFILQWKDKKGKNILIILTSLTALFGFFVIIGALRGY